MRDLDIMPKLETKLMLKVTKKEINKERVEIAMTSSIARQT